MSRKKTKTDAKKPKPPKDPKLEILREEIKSYKLELKWMLLKYKKLTLSEDLEPALQRAVIKDLVASNNSLVAQIARTEAQLADSDSQQSVKESKYKDLYKEMENIQTISVRILTELCERNLISHINRNRERRRISIARSNRGRAYKEK